MRKWLAQWLRQAANRLDPEHGPAEQIRALEEILVARDELEQAMYDSDLEACWPTRSRELETAYYERFGDYETRQGP